MAGIDNSEILLKSDYQFKGPLTENFILQQLCGNSRLHPGTFLTRAVKSTLWCRMGQRLFP